MEPISLALAITPLCIQALVGLRSRLKIFRHHCKEIKQVRKKLKIQGDCFRDELHLLLLKVVDPQVAVAMMNDQSHTNWQSADLETKVRLYLGEKYDSYMEAVDEGQEIIERLLSKLSVYKLPGTTAPLTKSAHDAFRIAFKKEEYVEFIEGLKESSAEMKRLRKVANKINGSAKKTVDLQLPPGYEVTRRMSSSLYYLIRARFSCTKAYFQHGAKLILNTTNEETPNINLLFQHICSGAVLGAEDLQPVHASYKDIEFSSSKLLTPDPSPCAGQIPKRRRVDNTGYYDRHSTITRSITSCIVDHECDGEDLHQKMINCGPSSLAVAKSRPLCSIGYIDIRDKQRLVLYKGLQGLRVDCLGHGLNRVAALDDILNIPAYDVFSDKDRIKLGITLVKSMLKYHSTPWWPQAWTLKEVYIFHGRDADIHLDTLHLSLKFSPISSNTDATNLASITPNEENSRLDSLPLESVQDAMDNYGIRNLTLYGLGVALLQIGLWDHVAWEDHVQVRRKVARLSYLGKQYRDATKRLIDCDFGLATEQLHDKQLQSAIFNHVVGDLESLLVLI